MALAAMPLPASHLPEAAQLYGAAFRDDPFVLAALPGLSGDQRERCLRGFFAASAAACVKRGLPWEFREGDEMVAILIAHRPGGYPPPLMEQLAVFFKSAWHIRFMKWGLPAATRRLLLFWNELARVHPRGTHYYAEYLAVKPEYQGKGLATLFAQTLLPTADQNQIGIYLESPNPRTVPLYERLGFRLVGQKQILGVPFALMWRDPAPQPVA